MRQSLMIAGFLAALPTLAAAEKPQLTVYTYDSFTADWGPGPAIAKAFEATCDCTIKYVTAGDAAALLSRVLLEGKGGKADVVVGLDTNLTEQARQSGLFAPAPALSVSYDLPVKWTDTTFVPYDWGYFAFVYDKTRLSAPPADFKALGASKLKIVIEDPRSASPGLGLLMWVKKAYGDQAGEVWKGLADNIVTVTPGWSEAYGLFLKGEADMVLSYTTSPAYHIEAEKDDTKAAAPFTEGHYMQIEVAGKMAGAKEPALADRFLAFLAGPEAQAILPETNWMYPVVTPKGGLPASFATLIKPEKALLFSPEEAAATRSAATEEWRAALSK